MKTQSVELEASEVQDNDFQVKDVCVWLQAYKGYAAKLYGYSIELSINASGDILFEKVSLKSIYDNILVDSTFNIPKMSEQYKAGVVLDLIEEWLSALDPLEKQIIFFAYMLHNFEKHRGWFEEMREGENGKKKYKTLTYKQIAEKFGCSEGTIRNIRDRAFKKIIKKIINV